ncbi:MULTISPECIES: hypothetical protein [unclassified Crossiella]|uniref:hypothetical protein n=1 Tax=unclassified Crossiella TaxID=2620835 RepID=UPI001FFEFD9A|nr:MULTISPECIES: hypothetical protein [unclassified Crossiella]MCK2239974.1 hypothetical protein [Crossiella sp. S99.2]MCK2252682.1 hypothetical protein [Crossiella sp. S99.1]
MAYLGVSVALAVLAIAVATGLIRPFSTSPGPSPAELGMAERPAEEFLMTGQARRVPEIADCIRLSSDTGLSVLLLGPAVTTVSDAITGSPTGLVRVKAWGRLSADSAGRPPPCRIGPGFLAHSASTEST